MTEIDPEMCFRNYQSCGQMVNSNAGRLPTARNLNPTNPTNPAKTKNVALTKILPNYRLSVPLGRPISFASPRIWHFLHRRRIDPAHMRRESESYAARRRCPKYSVLVFLAPGVCLESNIKIER